MRSFKASPSAASQGFLSLNALPFHWVGVTSFWWQENFRICIKLKLCICFFYVIGLHSTEEPYLQEQSLATCNWMHGNSTKLHQGRQCPQITCCNFCLALKWLGSWTRRSLKAPSNCSVLLYSTLLYSTLLFSKIEVVYEGLPQYHELRVGHQVAYRVLTEADG